MDPIKFLDSLDTQKHVILAYDDQDFGNMIQFRFINNGLVKGENCIYLTHGDPKIIRDEMEESGINVKGFVRKNLLHIMKISSPERHPGGILAGYENIVKQATSNKKPPYRMVGKIIPDTRIEEAMSVQITIERMAHTNFEKFNATVLCTYDFNEIPVNDYKLWLNRLFSYHHAAIVSTHSGMSMAGYL